MALTISQLFTPTESGVGLNPNVPPPTGTWLDVLLQTATTLGLPTTSWHPGAPERTILSIAAVSLAQEDVAISLMAQGGFLDFSAGGTVTSVAINGESVTSPVTPDPSIPSQNPTGAAGWLDALGQSFFEVTRLQASYASGQLAIANTGVAVLNYLAGTYHVANSVTGATYVNTAALAIPSSQIPGAGGVVTAVTAGPSTTAVTTSAAHGLAPNQVVYISGVQGIAGINGAFATVVTVGTPTTFTIARATSGTWTSGGTVFLCTVASFAADAIGLDSNAAVGFVTTTVTANGGVFVYNLTSWSASNYESNAAYAARCRLKLGALSPNGPAAAYDYFALTAQELLLAQTPSVSLTNGPIEISTTTSNPVTGVVTVLVSSSTPVSIILGDPVTPGCVQLPLTAASNATPIVITAAAHGLLSGDAATISGVLGNTAANGTWTITTLTVNTFSLNSSIGNGAYTGGGVVEGGDLGQIDALIQASVVPDGIIALVESALAFPVLVVATVVVPQAYVTTYAANAITYLERLLASFPIGGNIPPPPPVLPGTVPYSAVLGALVDAGSLTVGSVSIVRQVTSLTINGVSVDLNYPAPNYVAQLPTPTITVVGV